MEDVGRVTNALSAVSQLMQHHNRRDAVGDALPPLAEPHRQERMGNRMSLYSNFHASVKIRFFCVKS